MEASSLVEKSFPEFSVHHAEAWWIEARTIIESQATSCDDMTPNVFRDYILRNRVALGIDERFVMTIM